jgi:hypothetical protein
MSTAIIPMWLAATAFFLAACPAPTSPPATRVRPAGPGLLVALPADGAVIIDWAKPPSGTSVVVYLATASGVTPENYAGLPGGRRISGLAPPYRVGGLTNGVPVHAVVTSVTSSLESLPSPEASATPLADCTCQGWQVCDLHGACVAPAGQGEYLPGACFHALSDHWQTLNVPPLEDVFVPSYHLPGVRAAVRARLAALAASGLRLVKTQVWIVTDATTGPIPGAFDFPPSARQLQNLRDYAAAAHSGP